MFPRPVFALALGLALSGCPQRIEGVEAPDETTPDAGAPEDAGAAPDAGSHDPCADVVPAGGPNCVREGQGESIAVFRAGQWFVDTNDSFHYEAECDETFTFGRAGDVPVAGDFTNSGIIDVGVFRAGTWILDTDHDRKETACDPHFTLGGAGDVPVVGRWGQGGRFALGVFTPSTGTFGLDVDGDHEIAAFEKFSYGGATDTPVGGDWNGDGLASVGIFTPAQPNNAFWTLDGNDDHRYSSADSSISFGLKDDRPIAGDWTGAGRTSIGVFRGGSWTLERSTAGNPNDAANWIGLTFGGAGDVPVVMKR